ncbi:MAG TPA: energy transducer TonB [Thermoanaerobaculia bacterium]
MFATALQAQDATVERWKTRIDQSGESLKKGDYGKSLQISNALIEEMINRLGPGQGSSEIFGLVLTHKAIALAGLDRDEEALWHWHTVMGLYPAYGSRNLSEFGNPGRFLMQNRKVHSRSEGGAPVDGPKQPKVTAPKIKRRVEPRYPPGARAFGVTGALQVEVIIETDGRVTGPTIVKPLPAPTMSYVVLDAIRQWRFEPGKADGVAKPVIFKLTVNYAP